MKFLQYKRSVSPHGKPPLRPTSRHNIMKYLISALTLPAGMEVVDL
jgi:hypothetical protein